MKKTIIAAILMTTLQANASEPKYLSDSTCQIMSLVRNSVFDTGVRESYGGIRQDRIQYLRMLSQELAVDSGAATSASMLYAIGNIAEKSYRLGVNGKGDKTGYYAIQLEDMLKGICKPEYVKIPD